MSLSHSKTSPLGTSRRAAQVVGVWEKALAILASDNRCSFLASLASALPMAARGEYMEAGGSREHAISSLRAVNEMMLVVATQLKSSLEGEPAYPDNAFLRALADHARAEGSQRVLSWALAQAVNGVADGIQP